MHPIKCAAMILFFSFCFQVVDFIPVDCTEQADIDKLHSRIKHEVLNKETFPSIEQTLPRCYCEVENEIQELLKNGDIAEHGQYFFFSILRLQCLLCLFLNKSEICFY